VNGQLNNELAEALMEWRDAGGPVEEIVTTIQAMIWEAVEGAVSSIQGEKIDSM
jgi:hypothetical protein